MTLDKAVLASMLSAKHGKEMTRREQIEADLEEIEERLNEIAAEVRQLQTLFEGELDEKYTRHFAAKRRPYINLRSRLEQERKRLPNLPKGET